MQDYQESGIPMEEYSRQFNGDYEALLQSVIEPVMRKLKLAFEAKGVLLQQLSLPLLTAAACPYAGYVADIPTLKRKMLLHIEGVAASRKIFFIRKYIHHATITGEDTAYYKIEEVSERLLEQLVSEGIRKSELRGL